MEFAPKALKDLKRIRGNQGVKPVRRALAALGKSPMPENLDIKKLKGEMPPLYRVRAGDYRVLYESLDISALRELGKRDEAQYESGWFVLRVVDRKELDKAIESLKTSGRLESVLRLG